MTDKIYTRKEKATLRDVTIDKDNNIVVGYNEIGSKIIMTVKVFKELYE